MGCHDVIQKDAAKRSTPKMIFKSIYCMAAVLLFTALICSCSYNIYEAAHWGNTEKVMGYLEGGVDVNTPDRWGRTPLAIALFRKHWDTARLLVDKGAQINVIDPFRDAPIILYPVIVGNLEMTRYLINHGADVNLADRKGFTALIEAAYHGHTEIGRLLIEHGADINASTVENVTALSNARGRKNTAFEKMLVEVIEEREKEESLYLQAKRGNSIPAYEKYLNDFPKGKHAEKSQAALETLYFTETTRLQTLQANQTYLKRFPNGKHSETVRHRLDYLPLMSACLHLDYAKINQLLAAGMSLDGKTEPAIALMRLLQKQTQQSMRLSEFQVQGVKGQSEEERQLDLEKFKKLLDAGASPHLMRIKGFKKPGRESLDGVAELYSTGSPGKIVPAGEGGMSALQFAEANHLSSFKASLLSQAKNSSSIYAGEENDARNSTGTPSKASIRLSEKSSGKARKTGSEEIPTFVALDTRHFKMMKIQKCRNYRPDYSKYHTIIHLLSNKSIGTSEKGGKYFKAYLATADGKDPISGEQRRMSFSIDLNAFFSGAGTRGNPAKMHMRTGEPGTRITFEGNKDDAFEPVPGLRVWQGAIDIDPECGLIIRAKRAK